MILPSLYASLLEHVDPRYLESLEAVIVAGEICPSEVARRHYALPCNATLYNEYGPTEGTVWCTVYEVPADEDGFRIPIGRPIANTQVYLLDPAGQPVPIGVPGELHIAGEGLARGYLNRPELTDERFVRRALDGGFETRLYRTGDMARYLADGNIEFLGRNDHQVKIRGYRVELEEIEALLARHHAVRDALVVARDDRADQGGAGDLLEKLSAVGEETAEEFLTDIEELPEETVELLLAHGVRSGFAGARQ